MEVILISSRKVLFSQHNSFGDSFITAAIMRTEGDTATSPGQIKNNTCVLIYGNSSSLKENSALYLSLFF